MLYPACLDGIELEDAENCVIVTDISYQRLVLPFEISIQLPRGDIPHFSSLFALSLSTDTAVIAPARLF